MKPKKGLTSIIEGLIRPLPMVPMTRTEFRKNLTRTAGLFRESLQAKKRSAFIRSHFGTLTSGDQVPTDVSHHESSQEVRAKLSSTEYPMTLYARLKSFGPLSREATHALLFNPHLTSLDDINHVASETCIPASYVVAKLLKVKCPLADIESWFKKVPSMDGLTSYVRELEANSSWVHSRNLEHLYECRISIQQVQMDITAHLSYSLLQNGVKDSYEIWRRFCSASEISRPTKITMTKLPSLWLLKQALNSKEHVKPAIVSAIVDWDSNVLAVPQTATRRRLARDIITMLASETLDNVAYPTNASSVLKSNKEVFEEEDIIDYAEMIVQSWRRWRTPQDSKKIFNFLGWAMRRSTGAGLLGRARLERLKNEFETKISETETSILQGVLES